jgi:ubiquinone/menaquinone biosynthesis C-methylase UbiE
VRDIVEGAGTRPDRRSIAAAAALHFGTERFDRDVARFLDRTADAVEAGSRRVGHRSHALLDVASRRRKAQKLITLLRRRRPLEGSLLLEIGTGSGVMAADLAVAVGPDGRVVSVDVCDERVTSQGFDFVPVVGTHLPFPDATFDVVVSNHVFEHVGGRSEQLNHLREMLRVLRPDGLAYLATPNRWGLLEPHYRLPLLSWLPARAASAYLRATRRGDIYDVRSPSRRTLHEIARDAGFIAHECSIEAMRVLAEIEDPALAVRVIARAPTAMLRLGLPVVPTMVFVMRRGSQP